MIGIVCQICGKRPATSHLTELDAEGRHRELHLCATCIEQLDLKLDSDPPTITDLLAKKAAAPTAEAEEEDEDGEEEAEAEAAADLTCSSCGLTFAEFTVNNRFGCARCYQDFGEKVEALLSRYHGSGLHAGRLPAARQRGPDDRAIRRAQLDAQLKDAVATEAYERAARLRDEIRRLDETEA